MTSTLMGVPPPTPGSPTANGPGEAQARHELKELKGRFLSTLNHEIRTPITGILGMADLLDETALTPLQKEYVSIFRSCAQNLYQLLSATLEFAALSAGEARPEIAPFPLMYTLEVIAAEHLMKAKAKGLKFQFQIDGDLPDLVAGDEIRLRQLLTQLLSNAIKFTDRGEIALAVTGRTGPAGELMLGIAVRDTGIGIPESKLGRVLESFEQVESGLARQYEGLGLGLALVREITALLGGTLEVESEEGVGSVFTVALPFRRIEAEPEEPSLAGREALPVIGRVRSRVLIVEDNRVSQRVVSHMLEKNGFDTECADSGMAALRAASGTQYDLILMDLQMPEMDGIEATHRIRRLPGYARTPIVALTANSGVEFRELCQENGLQGFLTKPIQASELGDAVRSFVRAAHA